MKHFSKQRSLIIMIKKCLKKNDSSLKSIYLILKHQFHEKDIFTTLKNTLKNLK